MLVEFAALSSISGGPRRNCTHVITCTTERDTCYQLSYVGVATAPRAKEMKEKKKEKEWRVLPSFQLSFLDFAAEFCTEQYRDEWTAFCAFFFLGGEGGGEDVKIYRVWHTWSGKNFIWNERVKSNDLKWRIVYCFYSGEVTNHLQKLKITVAKMRESLRAKKCRYVSEWVGHRQNWIKGQVAASNEARNKFASR